MDKRQAHVKLKDAALGIVTYLARNQQCERTCFMWEWDTTMRPMHFWVERCDGERFETCSGNSYDELVRNVRARRDQLAGRY